MIELTSSLRFLKAVRQPKDQKATVLEAIPWLMEAVQRTVICILHRRVSPSRRSVLFLEGDQDPYLVIIVNGSIDIIKSLINAETDVTPVKEKFGDVVTRR